MRLLLCIWIASLLALVTACHRKNSLVSGIREPTNIQIFAVTGRVQAVELIQKRITIRHQAVPNYMPAMTMPFKVKRTEDLIGVRTGDQIAFRLLVEGDESWIDQIAIQTKAPAQATDVPIDSRAATTNQNSSQDYAFTNEFGRAVNLADFAGQALALTFFFTRCPVPDYCPRLSKNFSEASQRLSAMADAPTNWHFLSVSFDSDFDTPGILRAYAVRYHYDSNHWSFLTGPKDRIAKLANLFGFDFQPDSGIFNHGFRTVVIDASNRVQQVYPFVGDFADALVKDILKAATGTTNSK